MRHVATSTIRHFGQGDTTQIERRSNLSNPVTGSSAPALELSASVSPGASSLVAGVPSGGLVGTLVNGSTFTLDGDAYTVTADADADEAADTITVSFTPPAVGSYSLGESFNIQSYIVRTTYKVVVTNIREEDRIFLKGGHEAQTRTMHLRYDASKPAPKDGDVVIDNGERLSIYRVKEVRPADMISAWQIFYGEAI